MWNKKITGLHLLLSMTIQQRIATEIANQQRELQREGQDFTRFLQNVEPINDDPSPLSVKIVQSRRMFDGALKVFDVTLKNDKTLQSFRHNTRKAIVETMERFLEEMRGLKFNIDVSAYFEKKEANGTTLSYKQKFRLKTTFHVQEVSQTAQTVPKAFDDISTQIEESRIVGSDWRLISIPGLKLSLFPPPIPNNQEGGSYIPTPEWIVGRKLW